MVDKIILDETGNLATYTKNAPDKQNISYDKEFINILSNFIKKHPSFSFNNAKGLLCLTGYDGILGYRTNLTGINRESEIIKATKNSAKIKRRRLGIRFAQLWSLSYEEYIKRVI